MRGAGRGQKLAGAAKTSFVGKCVKDAAGAATGECEKAAADKKLAGAAKNSFIQKCVKTGAAVDPAAKCEGGGRQEAGWRGQEQLCPEV